MDLAGLLAFWDDSCRAEGSGQLPARPGFSGASVFRIETPRGPLAVRGWPRGGLPRRRLESLHRLLAFVTDQVPVAVPLPSADGGTLVDWQGRCWQLEPWLPGQADYHERPTAGRLAAAMDCLASFHEAAARFVPAAEGRQWFSSSPAAPSPALEERLKRLHRFESHWETLPGRAIRLKGLTDEVRELLERIAGLFPRGAGRVGADLLEAGRRTYPLQPCLRDIWHDHLLWTGERVSGLIDPGACRRDNVATDLARLVGSLVGDDREGWDEALEAYTCRRRLSAGEIALVGVLDRSGVLLAGAVWIERFAEGRVGMIVDELVDKRVIERVAAVAERLETLVATG